MTDRVKACPGNDLKQMPTEQLDVLLQTELKKELPDESIVMPILQELQEREKDYPVKVPEGLDEHMAGYKDRIHISTVKPRKRHKKGIRIAAVAAVLCVVLMAIPRTVGAESVFQVLFRWTESIFEFISKGDNRAEPAVEYEFKTDNEGLQELYDAVAAEGVTDPVVPMWLPDGYELKELKTMNYPDGDKVVAELKKGDGFVMVSYRLCNSDVSTLFEKTDSSTKRYEIDGITHFVLDNIGSTTVVWMQGTVECAISTNLSEEITYKIIASIYGSE